MNSEPVSSPETTTLKKSVTIRIFGVGGAGGNAVSHMAFAGFEGVSFIAVNTDAQALAACAVGEKLHLGAKTMRGLGAGGDPELGRAAAESDTARLKALCEGADIVFIVAGLGGGTGTGASPVLAKVAKDCGALVLGIVTTPFDCEGSRRRRQAMLGLEHLKAAADGVICLPNQKVFKLIDENTSLVETFKITNDLLTRGVLGIWRLVTQTGLINIDFADLCSVLRGRHAESFLASAEAMGPNRSREVVEKLLANPFLEGGQMLAAAEAVLVSIVGGAEMTMAEVNHVVEQINRNCEGAHIIMGAIVRDDFANRFAVTLVASQKGASEQAISTDEEMDSNTLALPTEAPELDTQFLSQAATARPASRFVAPPPSLTPEKTEQLLASQATQSGKQRKKASRLRQGQLPLEIISKGRFEKSEPTIHKGEDLDVPTYIRRGIALN